jgi:hypothetical protein
MLLRHSAAGLAEISANGSAAEAMLEQMLIRHGQRPSPAEVRSWQRSLPLLAQDLVQAGLGDVEVLVEYRLPLTSKRADAILAGQHPRTGAPSYVVVELKQERDRVVAPRRAGPPRVERPARYRIPVIYPDSAQGRWPGFPPGPEPV